MSVFREKVGQIRGRQIRIPIISELLGRDIDRGKVLVGLYEPSAQWLSLILTIASEMLQDDYTVGILTLATSPAAIRRQISAGTAKVKTLAAEKLTIIDWYTWTTGEKSTERRSVDSLGLGQFNVQDAKFQREDSPIYDFLTADNLSTFLKYNDERTFMQWLDKTFARMKILKGVRLYGFIKHFHSDSFYANLEAMADGVIELDMTQKGKRLENTIRIKSMKGLQHATEWRTLKPPRAGFVKLGPRF